MSQVTESQATAQPQGIPFYIRALTPMHPGVGTGVGNVDLPVARERATGIPYLPGSSIKGVLRYEAENRKWPAEKITQVLGGLNEPEPPSPSELARVVFGPDVKRAFEHAGAVGFGDAKLLLLPVRSYEGIFAYATSPFLLKRYFYELKILGASNADIDVPNLGTEQAVVPEESRVMFKEKLILEDLSLNAKGDKKAWSRIFSEFAQALKPLELPWPLEERLAVISDTAFSYLLETALEVVARIRLDAATKTVEQGALWYEENLPAESVLYGIVSLPNESFGRLKKDEAATTLKRTQMLHYLKELAARPLQFGGNASVGRGLARMVLAKEPEARHE